jgi:C_GCAxxG_C_C family probable redox protein
MSNLENSLKLFDKGFNCSQAVAAPLAKQFGIKEEVALKFASSFGGGIGRMGETCGAVTGALMIIGLKYGATKPEDKDSKENTYAKVKDFIEEFKKRNNKLVCKELLGCDISTEEGQKIAKEKDFHHTLCPKFVKDAVEICETIIKNSI